MLFLNQGRRAEGGESERASERERERERAYDGYSMLPSFTLFYFLLNYFTSRSQCIVAAAAFVDALVCAWVNDCVCVCAWVRTCA